MIESRISSRKLCVMSTQGLPVLRAFDVLGPRVGSGRERQVTVGATGEGHVLHACVADVHRVRAGVPDELRGLRGRVGDVHRGGEGDGIPAHRRHLFDLGERPPRATVPGQSPRQRQVPALPGIPDRPDDSIGRQDVRCVPFEAGWQSHPRGRVVVVLIELHELPRREPCPILHRDRHRTLHGVSGEIRGGGLVQVRPTRRPDDEYLFLLVALIGLLQDRRPLPRSTQRDSLVDQDVIVDRERASG